MTNDELRAAELPEWTKQGVWGCSVGRECQWKGFKLCHIGMGLGTVPDNEPWREWHDRECKGHLVQIIQPSTGGGEAE